MASPDRISPAGAVLVLRSFGKRTHKPNSVSCGHSSRRRVAADALQRPTRRFQPLLGAALWRRAGTTRGHCSGPAHPSLFGLAPCGVYPASCLTAGAVRSYRTFSPLPLRGAASWTGPAAWRYLFCGTGRPWALTPTSRTLSGTLPCGVRTFLPRHPGLRLSCRQRPPGPPAGFSLPRIDAGVRSSQRTVDS
jgi:hypothetical protein